MCWHGSELWSALFWGGLAFLSVQLLLEFTSLSKAFLKTQLFSKPRATKNVQIPFLGPYQKLHPNNFQGSSPWPALKHFKECVGMVMNYGPLCSGGSSLSVFLIASGTRCCFSCQNPIFNNFSCSRFESFPAALFCCQSMSGTLQEAARLCSKICKVSLAPHVSFPSRSVLLPEPAWNSPRNSQALCGRACSKIRKVSLPLDPRVSQQLNWLPIGFLVKTFWKAIFFNTKTSQKPASPLSGSK